MIEAGCCVQLSDLRVEKLFKLLVFLAVVQGK